MKLLSKWTFSILSVTVCGDIFSVTCAFIGAKVIMVEIEPTASKSSSSAYFKAKSRHHTSSGSHRHNRRQRGKMLEPSSLPPRWGEGVAPPPTPQYNNTPLVSPQVSPEASERDMSRYHRRQVRASTSTVVKLVKFVMKLCDFMKFS